jgi:hypothetical protein
MNMINIDKYKSIIPKRELDLIKILNEECVEAKSKRRPDYHIVSIITGGNRWGEKRVFSFLEKRIGNKKGLLFAEGAAGETLARKPFQELYPDIRITPPDRNGIYDTIWDTEEEGKKWSENFNPTGLPKGISAFEAYTVYNEKVRFFGIEDSKLYILQYKLASEGKINDYFYEIASLRSEILFNNTVDLLDENEFNIGYLHITGFHDKTFESLSKERKIRYEKHFIYDL